MGLLAVTETAERLWQGKAPLTERDKEFVVQFAFHTEDRELTDRLITELAADGADRESICRKYQALAGFVPDWVRRIENLLISLELYRVHEKQAVKALSELLSAYGIPISEEEIRRSETASMQERVRKEASL